MCILGTLLILKACRHVICILHTQPHTQSHTHIQSDTHNHTYTPPNTYTPDIHAFSNQQNEEMYIVFNYKEKLKLMYTIKIVLILRNPLVKQDYTGPCSLSVMYSML